MSTPLRSVRRGIEALPHYLPPVGDRRFWLTQALVLAVFVSHAIVHAQANGVSDALVAIPYAFPVLYAALEFGFRGAVATTAFVWVLSLPYVIDDALIGARIDLTGHVLEMAILAVVAPVVGRVVEQERLARRAHEDAEVRYRALFGASGVPALVLDAQARVQEANPAAEALLGTRLSGRELAEVLGEEAAHLVLGADAVVTLRVSPGLELRAVVSRPEGEHGEPLTQVLFQDVTKEAAGSRRVRAFALAVLVAQEEERRRIAQELHDEAVQLVVELRRRIDRSARRRGRDDAADLVDARALADRVIDELRTVAVRLRPPDPDDLGLVAALEQLVEDVRQRETPLELAIDTTEETKLDPAVALALYRVAQEAITNAMHHSRAQRIFVELRVREGGARLAVADDGVGFLPAALEARRDGEQLGLLGMRERLELVGGELDIASSPGEGTTVVASIPL